MHNIKIWFDITNTPQVHFLLGIKSILDMNNNEFFYSARDFSETTKLLRKRIGNNFIIIGKHSGINNFIKAILLVKRFYEIFKLETDYDLSISCGSENAIWSSKIKNKKSIAFGDNDLAKQWTYARFVDFSFFPDSIQENVLVDQGIKKNKLYLYHGFKEDIYIAEYAPDKEFPVQIPFENYVVVRPENLNANYVETHQKSITPQLIKILSQKNINVVFLPRYQFDYNYISDASNIFIPENPLNGLDLCYFADAVFTGAGTLAREAACLGVPSFSFFAGERLLAVDKKLVAEKKMFFSRDPGQLVKEFISSKKNQPDQYRSRMVREEVKFKLNEVIDNLLEKNSNVLQSVI